MYLPNALIMGVDYDTFWRLTPKKLLPFLKAYEERKREELKQINFASWMSGIYVSYSIASVMGDKNIYPERPLPLFESEEDEDSRRKQEAEAFGAYAAMFNKEFKERREG